MDNDSEHSLLGSIADSDLSEIAIDTSEIVLDGLLEEGVLKDIPVFGWAVKAFKAQRSIRDRLFLKKVALFAQGARTVSGEKHEEFKRKIEDDKEHRKRVGESLLLFIERHERLEKSLLLGKLFAAHLNNDISYQDFSQLAAALDKAVLEDLEALRNNIPHLHMLRSQVREGLYRCGLMRIEIKVPAPSRKLFQAGIPTKSEGKVQYKLNQYGTLFIKHAFSPENSMKVFIDRE
jgi:hypothetical protein